MKSDTEVNSIKVKEKDDKHSYKKIFDLKNEYPLIYNKIIDKIEYLKKYEIDRIDDVQYSKDCAVKENKKIIAVLYSGGADSTFDILNELSNGNYVLPIMNIINSDDLTTNTNETVRYFCTFKTLKMLADVFNKKYKKTKLLEPILNISFQAHAMFSFSYSIQMINSTTISTLGYKLLQYIDEIHICSVLEDQEVSYINNMKNLYKASSKFIVKLNDKFSTNKQIKLPSLKFPLIKYYKKEICDGIYFLYNKTFDIHEPLPIISCENIDLFMMKTIKNNKVLVIEPCCSCNSCKRNKFDNITNTEYGMMKIGIDISKIKDKLFDY